MLCAVILLCVKQKKIYFNLKNALARVETKKNYLIQRC